MHFWLEMHLGFSLHDDGGFGNDSFSGGGNSRNRGGRNVFGGIPVAQGFGNEVDVDVGFSPSVGWSVMLKTTMMATSG